MGLPTSMNIYIYIYIYLGYKYIIPYGLTQWSSSYTLRCCEGEVEVEIDRVVINSFSGNLTILTLSLSKSKKIP